MDTDALQAAKQAAARFEIKQAGDQAVDHRITAIMWALIALAETMIAQTPASQLLVRDILAKWTAESRYAALLEEERAKALRGEPQPGAVGVEVQR